MNLLDPNLLWIPVILASLLTVHELGHIAVAKLLNLQLQKVGFRHFPFPHVFVEVAWPRRKSDRVLFLMSGFLTILSLVALARIAGIDYTPLWIAFGIQLMIETNPIYSDFVIMSITDRVSREIARTRASYKQVYKKIYSDYLYSARWYVHFLLWAVLVVAIIRFLK